MTMLDQTADLEAPVRRILTQSRHSFYLAFAITGVVELMSLAPIVYMWNVFDRVISVRSGITLVSLTTMVVAIYLFWALLDWLRNRLFVQLSAKLDWDLSASVFDASFRRYVGYSNVNLHQLLSELLTLRQALTGRPVLALMDAPFAIIFIAAGFVFHPLLALFVALATGAILITSFAAQRASAPLLKASNEENAAANQVAADSLRQAETTIAMGMLPAVRRKWFVRHQKFLQLQVNASEASGTMRGISKVVGMAMPSLQIALGAWLAIEGAITGGMVIAASLLIGKAISPLSNLISEWNQIISARQAYDRLNDLLKDDLIYGEQMSLPEPVGNLVVNGLVVIPPGTAKLVLNGLSFTMKPGELLAVIGPSAAGKTCLARALMGVWKPYQGSVRLDGVEISDWAHEELGPHLGYVPQEVQFLQASVAENIARLGDVDPEKVVAATKLIGAHEMVLKMPNGYDTKIGPGGYVLSGGQKQMIALARAFYCSPSFIVLDEPNSNLDDAAEQAFKKALQAICQAGSAVVVMTHDSKVARMADLLLVLREGRQIGFGPTAQVLESVRTAAATAANRSAPTPVTAPAPVAARAPAKPTAQSTPEPVVAPAAVQPFAAPAPAIAPFKPPAEPAAAPVAASIASPALVKPATPSAPALPPEVAAASVPEGMPAQSAPAPAAVAPPWPAPVSAPPTPAAAALAPSATAQGAVNPVTAPAPKPIVSPAAAPVTPPPATATAPPLMPPLPVQKAEPAAAPAAVPPPPNAAQVSVVIQPPTPVASTAPAAIPDAGEPV
jgi:PrtD family type I secretion system ABC transporter